MTAPPVIDHRVLEENYLGDAQMVADIVGIFLLHCEGQLDELRRAAAAADAEGLTRAGHKLKGGLLTIAATEAAAAARALEVAGREQDTGAAPQLLERLDGAFARLLPALEALRLS